MPKGSIAEGQYSADESRPRAKIMGHESMAQKDIVQRVVARDKANRHAVMPFDCV